MVHAAFFSPLPGSARPKPSPSIARSTMPPSLRTLSALPDYSQVSALTRRGDGGNTIPPDVARQVRKILQAAALPRAEARREYLRILEYQHDNPSPIAGMVQVGPAYRGALEALSHILAPYGYGEVRDMEGETPRSCKGKTVYDLNTGDSYRVTVCYCDGRFYIKAPAYFLGD